ncbi:MAG: hypothetical protein H6502_02845 [Candidatus Woesearchaeota archaeon]|nr:MAG: hypothetical protein H6502_02845 [Candidatus Woesearchaeota archaeon]
MNKRGAFLYLLDVFIAVTLILFSVTLIFSSYLNIPEKTSAFYVANSYLTYYLETPVYELNNPSVSTMIAKNQIHNIDNRLINEVAYQLALGNASIARDLVRLTYDNIVSEQFEFIYRFNDTVVFNTTPLDYQYAKVVVNRGFMTFFVDHGSVVGPVLTEVVVWV